jgi:putative phosphoesterase
VLEYSRTLFYRSQTENLYSHHEKIKNQVNTMLIGLISDTHDNLPMIEKAVKKLNEEKVALVLHAGDYVAPFVIPKFKALNAKLIGVFGNNDGDHEFLKKRFSECPNCEVRGRFAEINADGFKIALLHGDETELLDALVNCGGFDAVVHGHSHANVSRKNGKTLVVNPGEVCGYLTGKSTIALLDTVKQEARIVEL